MRHWAPRAVSRGAVPSVSVIPSGCKVGADDSSSTPDAAAWVEDLTLATGERLRMRPLRPDDKQAIATGLARLSAQSQYLRFFTAKTRFTDAELRYLTEVDGWNHYAIGVARIDDDGNEGEGVAVARFVRLPDEPEVAEPAIAVIDDMQGRGLGRRLMERLVQAGRERGVTRFRTEFLAVNSSMKELLEGLSPDARFVGEGATVVGEFPLVPPEPGLESRRWPLYEWLRLSASRAVELRRWFEMIFDREWLLAQLQRLAPGRNKD